MAITLGDTYSLAAAAAAEVCLFACALTALWWGNSKPHADLRFHRGNSKSPELVGAAGASAVAPPKRDDSAQFTSVYDLVLWRLHSQADPPADKPSRAAAPEPKADASSRTLPPWRRPKPPASPSEGDPGLDLQAFLGSLGQHCGLALAGLSDQAVNEQGASVLLGLERDYEAFGDGALLTRQLDTVLPRGVVLEPEGEQDRAYDDACDSYLADLELDLELHRDVVLEPEGEQDRAYDDACESYLAGLEELDWRRSSDVESASSRQLACTSLHGRLVQRVRKTVAAYVLWAI